jgi:Transposase DDE domain
MFPSLFGHTNSPLRQRCLGPVLQQLDGLLTTPRLHQDLLQPRPLRRRQRLYPLSVTLKMFLTQCLSDDPSCRTAVATTKERGWLPQAASPDTGAYCRSRDHLSSSGLAALVERTGCALENVCPPEQLWRGRRVWVVDGTGITLPDTPPNQAAYPQPAQQAPGCGFPVLKLVALMSLATGALVHYTCGTLSDHDQPLFYRLWPTLAPGDVVLGDRIFGSFATMALLSQRGIALVARRHAGCKERPGKCLGKGDRLVEWTATPRPPWLDPTIPLPKTLRVREVHFQVTRPGFRTKTIILATTLLDATCYPCEALAELYLQRWDMELWLRHIKTTLRMEMLRTKTSTRVAAELAMCLVGYNLIRTVMLDAAQEAQVPLPRVSFKSARVRVRLWCARLCHTTALNLCLGDYIRLIGRPRQGPQSRPSWTGGTACRQTASQTLSIPRSRGSLTSI